jgi:hypothetical protein
MSISTITINSVDYTSYASVIEANEYLAVDPVRMSQWDTLDADQKGSNLVAATRRLDQLNWEGLKVAPSQENAWPRSGVTDKEGNPVSSTGVPLDLENACILLAGSIALDSAASQAGGSGSNIKSVGAGSARVDFFRPTDGVALSDETAFSLVQQYIGSPTGLFGTATGTSSKSEFCDKGAPRLNEGYP